MKEYKNPDVKIIKYCEDVILTSSGVGENNDVLIKDKWSDDWKASF